MPDMTLSTIWDNRKAIAEMLRALHAWFVDRYAQKGNILIIGAGGTGKSTLCRILSGKYDFLLDSAESYEESIGVELQTRPGKAGQPAITFLVPPGQEHRRNATWAEPLAALADGDGFSIIPDCG